MQPRGENFSIEIPEGGEQLTKSVPAGDEMVDTHTYLVRDGWSVYSLLWFKGPTLGESDELASKSLLRDFLKGAEQGYQSGGGESGFKCEPRGQKNVSQNGYTGFEYNLTACTVPSRVRIYTKVVDDKREIYIATVVFGEEDENVGRFLKSFTVGRSNKQ
jgi:hypothetical protein